MPKMYSITELTQQLRALGVQPGGVLLIHCAFRAVRAVENGPRGLIAALRAAIGPNGTLVMPSWTGDDAVPFDPETTPASPDLGVVCDAFWREDGVLRSDHPFAFAAEGPRAAEIVAGPLPLPPHIPVSPVGRVHDLDGHVLLLGIGQDANTTLHLAELIADVPYRVTKHITVLDNGQPKRITYGENDHCCARFALAEGWLRDEELLREGRIGNAAAKLMAARDIVRIASAQLRRDPLIFLHSPEAGCEECDLARASVSRSG